MQIKSNKNVKKKNYFQKTFYFEKKLFQDLNLCMAFDKSMEYIITTH